MLASASGMCCNSTCQPRLRIAAVDLWESEKINVVAVVAVVVVVVVRGNLLLSE